MASALRSPPPCTVVPAQVPRRDDPARRPDVVERRGALLGDALQGRDQRWVAVRLASHPPRRREHGAQAGFGEHIGLTFFQRESPAYAVRTRCEISLVFVLKILFCFWRICAKFQTELVLHSSVGTNIP